MMGRKALLLVMALLPILTLTGCKNEPGEEPRASMGRQRVSENAAKEAQDTLGNILESALTQNNLNDLIDYFAKPDRDRLSAGSEPESEELNQRLASFNSSWNQKYGSDFDAEDNVASIYNYTFTPSGDGRLLNVVIGASHNLPAVTLKFVNEGQIGTDWRLDVPDNLNRQTLTSNLINQYNKLEAAKNSWPAEREDARRFVAHTIFQTFSQG